MCWLLTDYELPWDMHGFSPDGQTAFRHTISLDLRRPGKLPQKCPAYTLPRAEGSVEPWHVERLSCPLCDGRSWTVNASWVSHFSL